MTFEFVIDASRAAWRPTIRNSELECAARGVTPKKKENILDRENLVWKKSTAFSLRVIKLCRYLRKEKHEFDLSKQLIRSGTSIGANISESIRAQSRADFFSKLNIALKEAEETHYWLYLLSESEYLNPQQFHSIDHDCEEIIRLLVAITKTQTKNTE